MPFFYSKYNEACCTVLISAVYFVRDYFVRELYVTTVAKILHLQYVAVGTAGTDRTSLWSDSHSSLLKICGSIVSSNSCCDGAGCDGQKCFAIAGHNVCYWQWIGQLPCNR